MTNRILVITCIILSVFLYGNANAQTINYYATNTAMSIDNLPVDSLGTYNVTFEYGSYTGSFDFTSSGDASSAADAIVGELNTDTNISMVTDDGSNITSVFYIPYEVIGVGTKYRQIKSDYGTSWSNEGSVNNVFIADSMFARLMPVPIPAALWLFGSGLLGIVGIRRKFHK